MTRRPRPLSETERAAWDAYARQLAPMRGRHATARGSEALPVIVAPPPPPEPPPVPPLAPRPSHAPEPPRRPAAALAIGEAPGGVDRASWQRFRTGRLDAERKLDLHGHTAQRAFQALAGFLRAAQADGIRCVEVVTGRGSGGEIGVIRREFPSWLNRPDIRPLVLAAAHPHAANPGAVRLLLRRTR